MNKITDMTGRETLCVGGGNPAPGQSWAQYLEERYPGGVWHNGDYYPNGVPTTTTGCSTLPTSF